ncbi:MAG: hypothetical protein ACP5RF_02610 [Candidatus Micrarchaeia archaeon]
MPFYGVIFGISVLFATIYLAIISPLIGSMNSLGNAYSEVGAAASLESFISIYNNIGNLSYVEYSARLDNINYYNGNGTCIIESGSGSDYLVLKSK